MHWDRLFEDLEGQLASEWEAERAALDAESERLRISRIELGTRLRFLSAGRHPLLLDLIDGERSRVVVRDVGADWLAAEHRERRALTIVPLTAILGVSVDHGAMLESLEASPPVATLRGRMTLGFVLRDLARRRTPVTITTARGDAVHGTIDRAGADHLDLALHERDEPRRADAVHGFRIIPIAAISSLVVDNAGYGP